MNNVEGGRVETDADGRIWSLNLSHTFLTFSSLLLSILCTSLSSACCSLAYLIFYRFYNNEVSIMKVFTMCILKFFLFSRTEVNKL